VNINSKMTTVTGQVHFTCPHRLTGNLGCRTSWNLWNVYCLFTYLCHTKPSFE